MSSLFVAVGKTQNLEAYDDKKPVESVIPAKSGYMNKQILAYQAKRCFIPRIGLARPVLLLCDGHYSWLNAEFLNCLKKNLYYCIISPFPLNPHNE